MFYVIMRQGWRPEVVTGLEFALANSERKRNRKLSLRNDAPVIECRGYNKGTG